MSWLSTRILRPLCLILALFLTVVLQPSAFAQTVVLRVDGDIESAGGDGTGWGDDAFKFPQDALVVAAQFASEETPYEIWVAATDPSNPYRPDHDAANPMGTNDRSATFLLDFNDIQLLGGFPPGGGDLQDRDPALYETVLSGVLGVPDPGCGDPETGGCFIPNGTVACDNADCCEAVCAVLPDCCEVAWDQACADLAFSVCGSCGDPGAGNCFMDNGTRGCDDADCCATVCEGDPFCCEVAWDQGCATLASLACGVCGEPDSGDCFFENGTNGCSDLCGGEECPGCCALVCELDPLCCLEGFDWTGSCVSLANSLCLPDDPPPPADPLNAYHVVTADGVDDSVRIDGFTIADGLADGGSNGRGAGMFISNASPAVVRVTFTENSAPGHGGGAMHIEGTAHPLVVNCSMTGNDGTFGGAMHIDPAPASATLVNCLISGNTATDSGGGIDARSSFPATLDLINCTVTDNTAQSSGGGIWVVGTIEVTITNSILWGNVPDQIDGVATVTYSDVEGGWLGEGNLDPPLDPLFVDAGIGDYRLTIDSPCIDVANNDDVPCDQFDLDNDGITCDEFDPENNEGTPDLDLINRVLDGKNDGTDIVDMGSYEFRHPDVCSCPDSCPADVDGDCVVGVKDLLFLLGSWGPCVEPCPPFCPADFDGTCDVGVLDLLFLLGSWGPCPCNPGAVVLSLQEELDDACLTQDDWDELVAVITDPNASQADKDRYNCWMTHYLDDCNKCTCVDKGHCPDPDPFE